MKMKNRTISAISEKQIGKNKVFEIFLVVLATSTCVKRSNSALRYIKNIYRDRPQHRYFPVNITTV